MTKILKFMRNTKIDWSGVVLAPTHLATIAMYSIVYFISYSLQNVFWKGVVGGVKDGWRETFRL